MSDTRRQRLAYLMLVHTDPKQVYRLCATLLLDEKADIYIHVDLKSREDFSACQELSRERIRFISERYKIYWAGFHMVLATLALMKAAVEARVGYHHMVLVSGSDYPLKHPRAIHQDLLDSRFPQLINRINAFDSPEYYIHQVTHFHFRDGWIPSTTPDKILRKLATLSVWPIKRSLPEGLVPCEGSQWWVLTEECVQYLLMMVREQPDLSHLYRYAMAPDEHFFHTLVQNSPFAVEAAPIMAYTGKGMWKKANIHVVHPSLKKIYTLVDFDELMTTGKLFVRKVNTLDSTTLMDKLDHTFQTNKLECVPQSMASAGR
jgi:hypothetical protein